MVEQVLLAGTAACGELVLGQIYPKGLQPVEQLASEWEKHQGGVAEGNFYELTTNPVTPHPFCTVQSGAEEEKSGMKERS